MPYILAININILHPLYYCLKLIKTPQLEWDLSALVIFIYKTFRYPTLNNLQKEFYIV